MRELTIHVTSVSTHKKKIDTQQNFQLRKRMFALKIVKKYTTERKKKRRGKKKKRPGQKKISFSVEEKNSESKKNVQKPFFF